MSGTTIQWKHSKFSVIDLEGSERATVSNNNKQQREGTNINKSLLALGNVKRMQTFLSRIVAVSSLDC